MATLTTDAAGLPYPNDSEFLKDVPDFIRQLAQALDHKIIVTAESIEDLQTKIPSPVEGIVAWNKVMNSLLVFDGTIWRQVYPAVPRVTSSNAAPTPGTGAVGDIHVQY